MNRHIYFDLLSKIAKEHGVTSEQIKSKSRHPHIVRARDHFLAIIKWSTGLSYPVIAGFFNMDHSSVIQAVRRYEAFINGDLQDYRLMRKSKWALFVANKEKVCPTLTEKGNPNTCQ